MQQLKTMQLIHASFCMAVFSFALVSLLVNRDSLFFESPKALEGFLFPAFGVLCAILGTALFSVQIRNIDSASNTSHKLMQYQTAFLIKCGFLEAGALLNIVACLMGGNLFFLLFAGLNLVRLVTSRPTAGKIADALSLQDSDIL